VKLKLELENLAKFGPNLQQISSKFGPNFELKFAPNARFLPLETVARSQTNFGAKLWPLGKLWGGQNLAH